MLRQVRNMHVKAIKMRWLTGGDNYSYLLSTQDKTKSWLIDPAEVLEVLPNLDSSERKSIQFIANTHHHYDHAGGNTGILAALGKENIKPRVLAGSHVSPATTDVPEHQQQFTLGNLLVSCIRTPCHTQDSVCYHVKDPETSEQALFSGDTLFTAGCGRFFEGNAQEMDVALNQRILQEVGEPNWSLTRVYPGHEYTKGNAKFVRKAIYVNPNENKHFDNLEKFSLENDVTTGRFTLADETQFNPFMRLDDPIVRKAIGDANGSWTRVQVMDKLRKLKNIM
ncbi:ZYRO0C11374p [Zygosaccharomyces rouxii]|uniref:hydroxyacylglutathione hydrolase n=1 Tax=Zygosaccharomyces rouxii (strain ATCC 2623 / CBS 732 / NBRC 1130 / NCYC 568 / NRRL Y-229) TaxID=559307 RepID=C5DTU4_ZYGRC|nr:uncharacterized protein ZYRO0C11374g [Zygosaccharomyces rouxii]KAH9201620.1 beta-lactamase-like protein [Zygosaccharomyces rouxii]CAR27205.1 ZYRO0C11374p [Zygosaccharomyces rouxii]